MTPYYSEGGIDIYHGDCREILPSIGMADLIVTDPPYGIGWAATSRRKHGHEGFRMIVGDDGSVDVIGVLKLSQAQLKEGRHMYVFGPFDLSELIVRPPATLIWDKCLFGVGDLSIPWGPSYEPIQFAVDARRQQKTIRGKDGLAARMRRGSVIRIQRPHASGASRHPSEKPVDLLRQLIESSSVFDERVLDPFMGCGSTLVAAQLEGRRAIGIEIEERYCELAAKRVSQAQGVLPIEASA
jgi:DNA modification methylase